jgi:hypothetical protein
MNVVTARTRNGPGASGDNAAATQITAPLMTRRTERFERDSLEADFNQKHNRDRHDDDERTQDFAQKVRSASW